MTIPIRIIAAIGQRRQIGYRGDLPWRGDPLFERHMKVDLEHFKKVTMQDVVILGPKTARSTPRLDGRRTIIYFGGDQEEFLLRAEQEVRASQGNARTIWIAGGEMVYRAFKGYCNAPPLITHMAYNGPADRYLPEGVI